ncbi:hypothetical protein J1N35_000273 [Gossypium stocksii]|uniref:Uncharacterized protein n=1 Tax=Gossypium stocksii TaxID=47602 RepID=A0A9D4AIH6_9ROSI|nr:hypothetical protein J1N35_000273 [Gossypium stocksii]
MCPIEIFGHLEYVVSLIVYATMEMIKSDGVMWQFGWRQKIPSPPPEIKAPHKFDLQGKTNENWRDYHNEYIAFEIVG